MIPQLRKKSGGSSSRNFLQDTEAVETISLKHYARANSAPNTKGGDYGLEISPQSSYLKTLLLYADNSEEMRRWVFALKSVLKVCLCLNSIFLAIHLCYIVTFNRMTRLM